MIYELRTYKMVPELFDEYLERAERVLVPIIKDKIGFRIVGFWRALGETDGPLPPGQERQILPIPAQIVWMIEWESLEQRAQKWTELHNDEDWQREFDRKYYIGAHVKLIEPLGTSREIPST